jgi:hypothetical protein
MHRPIIVVGMGRSGTSLVASLIHYWGAYVNPAQLIAADQNNATGYWEYAPLVGFNNALLRALSSSVLVPPADEHYPRLIGLGLHDDYRASANRLVASMSDVHGPWVWKDPRLAMLLPFWLQFWHDAIFVVAFRHPCDVARSLSDSGSRSPRPLSASLLLWQRSMMQVFKQIPPTAPRLVVSYQSLLTQTRRECERLSRFLDQAVGVKVPTDNDGRLSRMRGAVRGKLQHHRQGAADPAVSLLSQGQRRLSELLGCLSSDVSVENSEIVQCELYPGWREYLLTCSVFTTALRLVDSEHYAKLSSTVARCDQRVYGASTADLKTIPPM